jgi:hypothetical protein
LARALSDQEWAGIVTAGVVIDGPARLGDSGVVDDWPSGQTTPISFLSGEGSGSGGMTRRPWRFISHATAGTAPRAAFRATARDGADALDTRRAGALPCAARFGGGFVAARRCGSARRVERGHDRVICPIES